MRLCRRHFVRSLMRLFALVTTTHTAATLDERVVFPSTCVPPQSRLAWRDSRSLLRHSVEVSLMIWYEVFDRVRCSVATQLIFEESATRDHFVSAITTCSARR